MARIQRGPSRVVRSAEEGAAFEAEAVADLHDAEALALPAAIGLQAIPA